MGKSLIILGVCLVGAGLFLSYGGKLPWLGRLPGDIRIEREGFSFYFPLGTCLLVSALISFLFWLFRR
ncbi:MAG TPA: DUF2905 domain-containing protein [Tichowtungia sp.]|nr:DUF2905 domain-containing protein [Tichowtungia sp.]HKL27000.1 DUF2905 domain-containing protein [Desulfuromonadales bacterium]